MAKRGGGEPYSLYKTMFLRLELCPCGRVIKYPSASGKLTRAHGDTALKCSKVYDVMNMGDKISLC